MTFIAKPALTFKVVQSDLRALVLTGRSDFAAATEFWEESHRVTCNSESCWMVGGREERGEIGGVMGEE